MNVKKRAYSVALFYSVSAALRAEKILKEGGVECKLIPIPRHLSSDCGICVRFPAEEEAKVRMALEGRVEIQAIYRLWGGERMIEVDVRGFSCPIPVVRTKKAMEEHPGEEIIVLVETEVSKENVSRLAEIKGYSVEVEKTAGGEYRLRLRPRAE